MAQVSAPISETCAAGQELGGLHADPRLAPGVLGVVLHPELGVARADQHDVAGGDGQAVGLRGSFVRSSAVMT